MSDRPETPEKTKQRLLDMLTKSSTASVSSALGNYQGSVEPSPASTYGRTNETASMPATPADEAHQNELAGIGKSLDATHLAASPTTVIAQSDETALTPKADSGKNKGKQIELLDENDVDIVRQSQHEDPFATETDAAQILGKDTSPTYQVRDDRAGKTPSNSTAQAHFGPEACVFVANLSQNFSDEQLEVAATQLFSQYGRVYLKIRRDPSGMPYGFAQFESEKNAQDAIQFGRGRLICGRPVRTEVAKVNRAVFLSKISGGKISEDEAHTVLVGQGDIEAVWHATPTDREINRLPEGIWVRFHFYDDCRDALKAFRDNDKYRVEQIRKPEVKVTSQNYMSQVPVFRGAPFPLYPADVRSIFVGNLNPATTQNEITVMFSGFGSVINVNLFQKGVTSASPVPQNGFAFVEFFTLEQAERAVVFGKMMYKSLRIEPKGPRRDMPKSFWFDPEGWTPGSWNAFWSAQSSQQGTSSVPFPGGNNNQQSVNAQSTTVPGYPIMPAYGNATGMPGGNEMMQTRAPAASSSQSATSVQNVQSSHAPNQFGYQTESDWSQFLQGFEGMNFQNPEASYVWPPTSSNHYGGSN